MAKLEIYKYGDKILRKKTESVVEINEEIKKLISDMFETMYAAPGVGLAASQIGILLRICVIDVHPDGKSAPLAMINPEIIEGENKILAEEGCLSFPGLYEKVKRFERVTVEYMDLDGKRLRIKSEGFLAKAVQHEIDHLYGKLFIDYLPDFKRKIMEREIKRIKKAGLW
ncbi:MAG: peptide deformylase [Endomicrobium sp.]|jgi:peptide deformylase|nr:peptide deformylase [Endomicrobium sp.]